MKIAYDYQIFSWQKYGGISRYFYEIITRIDLFDNFEVKILAGLYINEYLKQCESNLVIGRPRPLIPKTAKIANLLTFQFSKLWLSLQNNSSEPDLIHETYYLQKSIAPKNCPKVITVYDMILEKFQDILPSKAQAILPVKAQAIKRADRIICISHQTKEDLINILEVDPQKITVVYLGYSLKPDARINSESNWLNELDYHYILYVGMRTVYKNFDRLLKAYSSHPNLKNNFKLVCMGEQNFSRDELDKIYSLGLTENDVIYVSGSDRTLAQLYKNASVFVYPSLYEGFGIPPLEAMSFDCPVACSNTSSIPEVVGDAAEFFDPYDIDSIANALEKVLFSSGKKQTLIEQGKERIKNFSWDKCAKDTSLVYLSLL